MAVAKYSLLLFPLTTAGLGVWQIKRLNWKKELIEDIKARTTGEPVDLYKIDSLKDLDKFEYHRTKVRGRYDPNPDHQMFVKPKTLVMNREAAFKGRSEQMINTGAHVITPFELSDSNLRILVNRGWLPIKRFRELAHKGLPKEGDPPIELHGVLRKTEKPSAFVTNSIQDGDELLYRNIELLAKNLKTAPILIEAEENDPVVHLDGPIGGQTRLGVRNEHLNYAIVWFGLSLFSYLMWHGKYVRKFAQRAD